MTEIRKAYESGGSVVLTIPWIEPGRYYRLIKKDDNTFIVEAV